MSTVPAPVAPPVGAWKVARQLGPGLIIVLGCLLQVFVQIELGRHAVTHGTTRLAALDGLPGPRLVGLSCALLLLLGRYRFVEAVSTLLVAAFTVSTMIAVVALQATPCAVTSAQLVDGFRFRLPPSFNVAFAAFGIIGVGASELIYSPYWCLEKGYARRVGPNDGSPGWAARARGWLRILKIDATLSFVLYTRRRWRPTSWAQPSSTGRGSRSRTPT